MKTDTIGAGQAVLLLFLSRCFNFLNYIPAFLGRAEGMSILAGNLVSFLLQGFLLIPAILLYQRFPRQNVLEITCQKSRIFGIFLAVCYAAATLLNLTGSLVGFEYFITNAIFPKSPVIFIVISMAIVCILCARHGIQGIGRAACILAVYFLISTLFINLVSLKSADLLNIRPITEQPVASIARWASDSLAKSNELTLFVLLLPQIRSGQKRTAAGFLLLSLGFVESMIFFVLSVLGDYGLIQTFPYYSLASVADISIFQRLDSLHMMLWVIVAFVRITLMAIVCKACLQTALPKKLHGWIFPFILAVSYTAAILIGSRPEIIQNISSTNPALVILLSAGVPLILLLITRKEVPPPHEKTIESVLRPTADPDEPASNRVSG